jgi:hypothetical protein
MSTTYDDPTPNIPLLRKGVEWVEWQDSLPAIDSQWRQEDYLMTEYRHALALLSDDVQELSRVLSGPVQRTASQVSAHCGTAYCFAGYIGQLLDKRYERKDTVNFVHVADFARRQLGITEHQAQLLFDGCNRAADIRRICEAIAGEKL